jgi:putative peptidoglycan lipid II flippase
MALGTILSRILGFLRAILLAAMIGVTTNAADAFGVANQLPNNVYVIIVGGVLNAVLVPQLVKSHRNDADGGKGYVDRLLTLAITVFAGITVVATVAAPVLVHLYTHNWNNNQLALATAFAYWCLPQLFFYGLYSVLGEVLNSRSAFGPFMWAPVLNNVVSLAGMAAFVILFGLDPAGFRGVENWSEAQISLLAGTATLGVASQALILFVSWKRIGLNFKFNFNWRGVGLRPAVKAATWTLAMVIVTQLAGLVQSAVASLPAASREQGQAGLGVASIAAASIAWLIFMLPHSVFTVSLATAYFTRLTTHAHEEATENFKTDLGEGLRLISMVSILAATLLMVLAYPAARVFVGEYPATIALGNVIIALMLGLLPFSLNFFLQKAFYALEDTKTPFYTTLVQASVFTASALLIAWLAPASQVVVWLSLATTFAALIQVTLAARTLKARIGAYAIGLWSSMFKFALAAIGAGLVGYGLLGLFGGAAQGSFALSTVLAAMIASAIVAVAVVAVFVILLKAFKAPEADALFGFLRASVQKLKGIARR